MKQMMAVMALIGAVLSAGLLYLMIFQSPWSSFSEQGSQLTSMVWGQISLLDLYSGFFLALALVWLLETKLWVRILLTLLVPILGNPVLAIWLLVRFKSLQQRLSV